MTEVPLPALLCLVLMSMFLGALLLECWYDHKRGIAHRHLLEQFKDTQLADDLQDLLNLTNRIGTNVGLIENPDGQPHGDPLFVPEKWFKQ